MWVRGIFMRREYHSLVQEMTMGDHESYFAHFRKNKCSFPLSIYGYIYIYIMWK